MTHDAWMQQQSDVQSTQQAQDPWAALGETEQDMWGAQGTWTSLGPQSQQPPAVEVRASAADAWLSEEQPAPEPAAQAAPTMPAAPPPKAQAKPSPPPLVTTPSPPPPKALPATVPPQPQQSLPLIKAPPEPVPANLPKTAPAFIPVKAVPAQHPPARAYSQGRDAQKTADPGPAGPKAPPAHMISENLPTPVLQPGQEKVPCRYGCGFSFDSVASEISHVGHCMHNANCRFYKDNPDRLPAQARGMLAAQRRANSQEPR